MLQVHVARAANACRLRRQAVRQSDGGWQRVIVGHFRVDQARVGQLARADRFSLGNDFDRPLDSNEARQALRATGTGNQAQLQFRHAQAGRLADHARMAGHGQFQSAAQRQPSDGRHHGLGAVFHRRRKAAQVRFGDMSFSAELAHVGAGRKRAVGAGDHDGLHRQIVLRGDQGPVQPLAQGLIQRVERWMVHANDGDVALQKIGFGHQMLHCNNMPPL